MRKDGLPPQEVKKNNLSFDSSAALYFSNYAWGGGVIVLVDVFPIVLIWKALALILLTPT
jgi:hypothetical protein